MATTKTAKKSGASDRKRLVAKRTLPLFARMGYEKVSFQDISDATGVPRTALYRYYRTKRQIFDAAIQEVLFDVRADLESVYEQKGDPIPRLKAVSERIMDTLYREQAFVQVIFDFVFAKIASGEDMARRVAAFTIGLKLTFRELTIAGQVAGNIRRDADADIVAELLFSTVESAALKMLLGSEKTSDKAKERINAAIESLIV